MNKKKVGLLLATAVAGLVLSGQVMAEEVAAGGEAKAAKVKCSGTNECKGKGACAGAENACAGQNGCKGKGWVEVGSDKECTDKGGTVVAN